MSTNRPSPMASARRDRIALETSSDLVFVSWPSCSPGIALVQVLAGDEPEHRVAQELEALVRLPRPRAGDVQVRAVGERELEQRGVAEVMPRCFANSASTRVSCSANPSAERTRGRRQPARSPGRGRGGVEQTAQPQPQRELASRRRRGGRRLGCASAVASASAAPAPAGSQSTAPERQGHVVSAEPHRVRECRRHAVCSGLIRYAVEVAFGIRFVQVDGRWNDSPRDHERDRGLEPAGGTEQVAGHGLRRASMSRRAWSPNTRLTAAISAGLRRGRGAVGVDVRHVLGAHAGVLERARHGARGALAVQAGAVM